MTTYTAKECRCWCPYPNKAYSADSASIVTGSIDGNATGTTQAITDNTTKMATTKFVHDLVNAELAAAVQQSSLSASNFSISENVCYKRLKLVGIRFAGTYTSIAQGPVTIAQVPSGYRPSSRISFYCMAGQLTDGYIETNGNVVVNHGLGSAMGSDVSFMCSYLVS